MRHDVFLSGGTGYLGAALAPELLRRGHAVRTVARRASTQRVPPGGSR